MNWRTIDSAPEGKPILTKIDDASGPRNECVLVKNRGMWWFEDKSMYVYYTPTHWSPPSLKPMEKDSGQS